MQTLQKAFEILDVLYTTEDLRLTDIADGLDLPPSTTHRYLRTLEANGYVVRDADTYRLSFKFLDYGIQVRNKRSEFPLVKTKTRLLSERTGERAQYLVQEGFRGIHLCHEVGENAVRTNSRIGKHVHLHATAAGKCILATLPEAELAEFLEQGNLPALTPHTITDTEMLREDLQRVRERGFGINDEERIEGLRSIGVPVFGKHDELLGAFSISGPTNRMLDDRLYDELSHLLLGAADEIRLRVAYTS